MNQNPTVSKSTFRGTLILILLIIVVFLFPDIWRYFKPIEKEQLSFHDPAFQKAVKDVQRDAIRYKYQKKRTSRYLAPSKAFDPNTYSLEDWMNLGLSEKQAAVILKFAKRGIRSNEDLKKIFVISDELFALIKDSTRYASKSEYEFRTNTERFETKTAVKIDVNTATIEELMTVKGIGPFFAKQIIKLRDELGGFYAEEQLLEVWKMDQEKLQVIAPSLLFNESKLHQLNINTATVEELKTHPYISWNLANSIVKLRSQNGRFKRIEDVKKSVLMTNELFEKLKRYLTID